MKKILIVTQDMRIGGAQKSLLSLLTSLEDNLLQGCELHLLVFQPSGPFYDRIPPSVQKLPTPRPLYWMGAHFDWSLLLRRFSLRGILGEARWVLGKGHFPRQLSSVQKLWLCWKDFVAPRQEGYDVAVSYMDGPPNYYVMDKVTARKKVLWLHSDYQGQGYDPEYDRPYFEKADAVVTISEKCRDGLLKAFPQCADNIHVLENLSCRQDILERSLEGSCPEFSGAECLRLLTVARLHPQKGIDLAVEAAKKLKETGIPFRWLVVGEGAQRAPLQEQIDSLGLTDCIRLIGARENPYAYMARCHILVQPSRVEGKSIVLDEAKLLRKPIVAANYPTVTDSVIHGQTGWIVEMTGEGLCAGILELWNAPDLRRRLEDNLSSQPAGEGEALEKYIRILF